MITGIQVSIIIKEGVDKTLNYCFLLRDFFITLYIPSNLYIPSKYSFDKVLFQTKVSPIKIYKLLENYISFGIFHFQMN